MSAELAGFLKIIIWNRVLLNPPKKNPKIMKLHISPSFLQYFLLLNYSCPIFTGNFDWGHRKIKKRRPSMHLYMIYTHTHTQTHLCLFK